MRRALAACALSACLFHVEHARSDEPRAPDRAIILEILATAQIPPEVEGVGTVGGLSGLITAGPLGASDADYLAISDHNTHPLLVRLHVELEARGEEGRTTYALSVGVDRPIAIACDAADAESLVGLLPIRASQRDAGLLIGFEKPPTVGRLAGADPREGADVMECAGALPLPDEVVRDGRPNRAVESLAWVGEGHDWGSPLGADRLWVAMEAALTTDGEEATPKRGSLCRVMIFDPTLSRLERQVFYETEPSPAPGVPGTFAINSLSEFCGLPDGRVLALERSLALPRGYNVTLFVLDGTTEARAGLALPVLKKERVADLRALGLVLMGNLEGMALGPTIASITGDEAEPGRLLLLIADDNFGRDGQVGSQVVALRLVVGE